jgi:hypothetical protein
VTHPTKVALKKQTIPVVGKDREKWDPHTLLAKWHNHFGKQSGCLLRERET